MKKLVEDHIKNAVELWENQKSDIGFDKDLAWQSIKTESIRTRWMIAWNKVAVILVLLLMSSGWGYSFIHNQRLQQDKITMVGHIQTLGSEIQMLQQNNTTNVITKEKIDTVVKVIHQDSNDRTLENKLDELQEQNQQLNNELKKMQLLLNSKDIECKMLSDSMEVLALQIHQRLNQKNKPVGDFEGDILMVDEEELLALSNGQKEKNQKQMQNQKSRFKLVIFNRQDKSVSKAPEKQGIRF